MKRFRNPMTLVSLGVLVASVGAVRAMDQWLELLRADLRADRVAILTEAMPMNTAERDLFWPIYRDYEVEQSALGDRRVALLKEYAKDYKSMSDERAAELMEEWFELQEDRTKLWEKYYKKVAKAISAGRAARFIQIEHQMAILIDIQVAGEVPLIHTVGSSGR